MGAVPKTLRENVSCLEDGVSGSSHVKAKRKFESGCRNFSLISGMSPWNSVWDFPSYYTLLLMGVVLSSFAFHLCPLKLRRRKNWSDFIHFWLITPNKNWKTTFLPFLAVSFLFVYFILFCFLHVLLGMDCCWEVLLVRGRSVPWPGSCLWAQHHGPPTPSSPPPVAGFWLSTWTLSGECL